MRVLEIGPSPYRSKGGMATVLREIEADKDMCSRFHIEIYDSYIDGSRLTVLLYSVFAFLRFYFTKRDFDIYHIHAASYGSTFRKGWYVSAAKRWGKKVVLHVHGAAYLVFYEQLSAGKKARVRSIWEKCDTVIALSEDWKSRFQKIFHSRNIVAVNNGIHAEQFEEARCDTASCRNCFLLLGRLGKRKGAYDVVEAVESIRTEFPAVKVYMAGDGEVEELRSVVEKKKLGRYIDIVGWADFSRKLGLMKECGTILLPSYHEGLPMTILEGMAAGKVIISTDVGGIPEVVQDGYNGIIIRPGDIEALGAAMKRLMTDESFDAACSEHNRDKIQREFSSRIMHQRLADIFMEFEDGI